MTLDQLSENESAIIESILDKELAVQLFAMGFIVGEEVKLERVAPLNDPILITSGNNHISIRKADAKHVEVKKIV